jgi:hypothetical protein
MATFKERRRRGEDILKKYRSCSGVDPYACAVDAMADLLLAVAQSEREATQILQAAELDFRNIAETESFLAEG